MGALSDYLTSHPRMKDVSNRQFAQLVGIGSRTADAILAGRSVPEERTLRKISDAIPDMPFAKLHELALRDTPFDLPPGAELLDLDERNHVKATITQLLKSSGKADRVPDAQPEEQADRKASGSGNVVELPQVPRVKRAAYDPPEE